MPPISSDSASRNVVLWSASVAGLLLAILSCFWWFRTETPKHLLERAMWNSENPTDALELTRASIRAAHGDFPDAQLFECQTLLQLKRTNEAERLFGEIGRPESCDPEALYAFSLKSMSANKLTLASKALSASGEFAHRTPERLKLLIYLLYSLRDGGPDESRILDLCREYALLVPDEAYPWLISSTVYHESHNLELASSAYRSALKCRLSAEEENRVRLQLIQVSMVLGNLAEARDHCDLLLANSVMPVFQSTMDGMQAELLYREGKLVDATALLDKLVASSPRSNQVRGLRGKCMYDQKNYAAAIADLTEAVRLNEFDQPSHYLLGQACLRENDEDRAKRHLERSRELVDVTTQIMALESRLKNDLQNPELKRRLADLNEQRGDHERAAAWRRGAAKDSSDRKPIP